MSERVPATTYGSYGLLLSLVPIGALITHHGLARHAARHWTDEAAGAGYTPFLVKAALIRTIPLAVLLAATLALVGPSGIAFGPTFPWLLAGGLTGAFAALSHTILQTTRRYWADCAFSCANSISRSGGPILAILAAGTSTTALIIGFVLPQILALAAAVLWLLARVSNIQPVPHSRGSGDVSLSRYDRDFWLLGLCTLAGGGLHRWIAASCLDSAQLGYFTLAGNIAFVLPNIASAAALQYIYPRLYARARMSPGDPASSYWKPTAVAAATFLILSLSGVTVLSFATPLLIGNLIHEGYWAAATYIIPTGFFGTAIALTNIALLPHLAIERTTRAACLFLLVIAIIAIGGFISAQSSAQSLSAWLASTPLIAIITIIAFHRLLGDRA
ncbi:hypothetical protein MASR2M8_25430 [Opitutaceae bacterium]